MGFRILTILVILFSYAICLSDAPFWAMGHHDNQNSGRSDYFGIQTDWVKTHQYPRLEGGSETYFSQTGVLSFMNTKTDLLLFSTAIIGGSKGQIQAYNVEKKTTAFIYNHTETITVSPMVSLKHDTTGEPILIFIDDSGKIIALDVEACVTTGCTVVHELQLNGIPTADPITNVVGVGHYHYYFTTSDRAGHKAIMNKIDSNGFTLAKQYVVDDTDSMSEAALTTDDEFLLWASETKFYIIALNKATDFFVASLNSPGPKEKFASAVVLSKNEKHAFIMTTAGRLMTIDVTFNAKAHTATAAIRYAGYYSYYVDIIEKPGEIVAMNHTVNNHPSPAVGPDGKSLIVPVAREDSLGIGGIYKVDISTGTVIWRWGENDYLDLDEQPTVDSFGVVYVHTIHQELSALAVIDTDPDPIKKFAALDRMFVYLGPKTIGETRRVVIAQVPKNGTMSSDIPTLFVAFHDDILQFSPGFRCPTAFEMDLCSGHGVCDFDTGKCVCSEPWTGKKDCSQPKKTIYPLVHHDTHNSGRIESAGPRLSGLTQTWVYQALLSETIRHSGVMGFGIPKLYPQLLYIGTSGGHLIALNTEDQGKEYFKLAVSGEIWGTPAVIGGTEYGELVFFGTSGLDAQSKKIYCINPEKCHQDIKSPDCIMFNSTIPYNVTGDMIPYYGPYGGLYFVATNGTSMVLYKYSLRTGNRLWEYSIPSNTAEYTEKPLYVAPAIDDRRLYVAHDCQLIIMDTITGRRLDRIQCPGTETAGYPPVDRFASDITISDNEEYVLVQLESGRFARYDINKFGRTGSLLSFRYACLGGDDSATCCYRTLSSCGYTSEFPSLPLPNPTLDPWGLVAFHSQYRLSGSTGPLTGLYLFRIDDGRQIWKVDKDERGRKHFSKTAPTTDLTGMAYITAKNYDQHFVIGLDIYPAPGDARGNVLFEKILPERALHDEFGHEQVIIREDVNYGRRMIITTHHHIWEFMESLGCPTNDSERVCSTAGNCNGRTGKCECNIGYTGQGCEAKISSDVYVCHSSTIEECSGHGYCNIAEGRCVCRDGYSGAGCEYSPNCPSTPEGVCNNHGSCTLSKTCKCDDPWQGFICEETCPTEQFGVECSGHGICIIYDEIPTCICTDGYYGASCGTNKRGEPDNIYGSPKPFGIFFTIAVGVVMSVIGVLAFLWYIGSFTCCGFFKTPTLTVEQENFHHLNRQYTAKANYGGLEK